MTSKISIIKGTVYNEKRELIWNAVVEVCEVNPITKISKVLGYTLTDKEGKYAFSIEASPDMIYELNIFPPLNV